MDGIRIRRGIATWRQESQSRVAAVKLLHTVDVSDVTFVFMEHMECSACTAAESV